MAKASRGRIPTSERFEVACFTSHPEVSCMHHLVPHPYKSNVAREVVGGGLDEDQQRENQPIDGVSPL
jgi:hypothetical protein